MTSEECQRRLAICYRLLCLTRGKEVIQAGDRALLEGITAGPKASGPGSGDDEGHQHSGVWKVGGDDHRGG